MLHRNPVLHIERRDPVALCYTCPIIAMAKKNEGNSLSFPVASFFSVAPYLIGCVFFIQIIFSFAYKNLGKLQGRRAGLLSLTIKVNVRSNFFVLVLE